MTAVCAQAKRAVEYKHVAVEVPLGCDQWVPRGCVLRCLIHDEGLQLVIEVDDHELRFEEFGKLLNTYSGWGMRTEFVPHEKYTPGTQVRSEEMMAGD